MPDVIDLVVESDEIVGHGFLSVRRMRLRNRHADGSVSAPYVCDFTVRAKGLDAITVAVWCRRGGRVQVLLRDGLRPALHFGRAGDAAPVPDRASYLFLRELVAGIVENDDRGEEGIRRRAALEVEEESGYRVGADDVVLLGSSFPSPGAMPERYWFSAVEVKDPDAPVRPHGDGSPMEEGARTAWMDLDEAIAACVRGDIEDAKTELALRRLRDRIG